MLSVTRSGPAPFPSKSLPRISIVSRAMPDSESSVASEVPSPDDLSEIQAALSLVGRAASVDEVCLSGCVGPKQPARGPFGCCRRAQRREPISPQCPHAAHNATNCALLSLCAVQEDVADEAEKDCSSGNGRRQNELHALRP